MVDRDDIDRSHVTLDALVAANFSAPIATLAPEEGGDWFLHIYSGLVDLKGPRASYQRLFDVTRTVARGMPMHRTRLLPFSRPEARAIGRFIRVTDHSDVRLQNTRLDGVLIEDLIVLRSELPAA